MRAARLVMQWRARQTTGLKRMQGRRVGHFERIKPATQHERNFVDQHIADRAQLAAKLAPVAQDPRVGERPAVGELVEGERDEGPVREIGLRCACASAPASTATPTGAARADSVSRSASHRLSETTIAPSAGMGASSPRNAHLSSTKPSRRHKGIRCLIQRRAGRHGCRTRLCLARANGRPARPRQA